MEEPQPTQYLVDENDLTHDQRMKLKTQRAMEALEAFRDELALERPYDDEFATLMFRAQIELNLYNWKFRQNGGPH